MKGLLLKDFYTMKSMYKQVLLIAIIYGVVAVFKSNYSFFVGAIMVVVPILSLSVFSYDDMSKWNNYVQSLPVKKNDIVKSKYLYSLLLLLFAAILSVITLLIVSLVQGAGVLLEGLIAMISTGSIAMLYIAILMPIIYKRGVEKARIVMMAVFLIPFISIMILSRLDLSWNFSMFENISAISLPLFCIIAPLFSLVSLFISFKISCKIFLNKRD